MAHGGSGAGSDGDPWARQHTYPSPGVGYWVWPLQRYVEMYEILVPPTRSVDGHITHGWVPTGASIATSIVIILGTPRPQVCSGPEAELGVLPDHIRALCLLAWGLYGGLWDQATDQRDPPAKHRPSVVLGRLRAHTRVTLSPLPGDRVTPGGGGEGQPDWKCTMGLASGCTLRGGPYLLLHLLLLCSAVLCYAVRSSAVQCCAVLYSAVLSCAVQCCAVLCSAELCFACCPVPCSAVLVLCCAVPCCAVQCCAVCRAGAVLCSAVLCSAVLCCAVLCCPVQCSAPCAVLCSAVLCCAVLCHAVPAVLCGAVLCCCVQCCAVLCSAVLVLCCAVLCCAVLCCAVPCSAVLGVLYFAVLSCAVLCCAVLCRAVRCCTVLLCAVLCCAVACSTVQWSAVLCSAVLWCAVLGAVSCILLQAAGTLEFSAPETLPTRDASGKYKRVAHYSQSSDVWSIGAIFFQVLHPILFTPY